ncbi:MAG: MoaD/ThiS family protein [Anaerolineaceae bacterium]|nr:MoaD/ThiS family protein [Anaerolineaceae bacterium]
MITILIRNQKHELEQKSIFVKDLMRDLELSPQAFLAVRDGELLTEGDLIRDGETVKMVAVISGGGR